MFPEHDNHFDALIYTYEALIQENPSYMVFYEGRFYEEYSTKALIKKIPNGSYFLNKHTGCWYLKTKGYLSKALEPDEVPKNLLALCLLLGISTKPTLIIEES